MEHTKEDHQGIRKELFDHITHSVLHTMPSKLPLPSLTSADSPRQHKYPTLVQDHLIEPLPLWNDSTAPESQPKETQDQMLSAEHQLPSTHANSKPSHSQEMPPTTHHLPPPMSEEYGQDFKSPLHDPFDPSPKSKIEDCEAQWLAHIIAIDLHPKIWDGFDNLDHTQYVAKNGINMPIRKNMVRKEESISTKISILRKSGSLGRI